MWADCFSKRFPSKWWKWSKFKQWINLYENSCFNHTANLFGIIASRGFYFLQTIFYKREMNLNMHKNSDKKEIILIKSKWISFKTVKTLTYIYNCRNRNCSLNYIISISGRYTDYICSLSQITRAKWINVWILYFIKCILSVYWRPTH